MFSQKKRFLCGLPYVDNMFMSLALPMPTLQVPPHLVIASFHSMSLSFLNQYTLNYMCTYMYVNMFANMYIIYKSVIACTISLFVSSLSNLPHRLHARQDLLAPWSPGPSDGLHKGGRFENPKESPRVGQPLTWWFKEGKYAQNAA